MTFTVKLAALAQAAASGVKVYVVVAFALTAGDHVPAIFSMDVVGNDSGSPEHMGAIAVKVGVIGLLTVTVKEAEFAQTPPLGVNV